MWSPLRPRLPFTWQVHRASWRSCGARGRRCMAPRLPFAWQAQYTEPPGGAAARVVAAGAAAAFRVAGAVHHLSHVTHHFSLTIVTTHVKHHSPLHFSPPTYHISLITSHLPLSPLMSSITHRSTSHHLAWQAQYTEPLGGAAARVVAAGAAAAFRVAGAVYTTYHMSLITSHLPLSPLMSSITHRSTSHPPLITSHSSLLTYHCHHSCQASLTAPLLTISRGRRSNRASWSGRRWGRGCLSRGRRSTQSLLEELRRAWSPLGPRLPFCGARGRRWGRGCLSRGRRSTQSLLEELRRAWSPLGPRLPFAWQAQYTTYRMSLITSHLPLSPLMSSITHRSTSHPPLITSHPSLLTYHCHHSCQASLTAPLLTISRGRRSTQSLLEELRRAWSPLGPRLPFAWRAQYKELRRAWSPLEPRLPFV